MPVLRAAPRPRAMTWPTRMRILRPFARRHRTPSILRAASIVHNYDAAEAGVREFGGQVYESVVGPVGGDNYG